MTDETAAPPRRKPPILAIVLGIAVLVLIVGGLWLANRPAPEQLQGMVDADEVNVATKALARVETLVADEGQRVRAGTLLATLSSPEIAGGKAQAQGAVDAARAIAAGAKQRGETVNFGPARIAFVTTPQGHEIEIMQMGEARAAA